MTTGWLATLLKEQANPFPLLATRGQMFNASAAAQDTTVTGATSFATTTPTFLLDVPSGTTALPAYMSLNQAGTVAGGAVSVLMEMDNADRYTSGGTAATVLNKRTDGGTALSTLYSATGTAIVATDAYGVRTMGLLTGQDVSPAEGIITEVVWTPAGGIELLVGPAAWLVYTFPAASTGPTWFWSFAWAEVRTVDV